MTPGERDGGASLEGVAYAVAAPGGLLRSVSATAVPEGADRRLVMARDPLFASTASLGGRGRAWALDATPPPPKQVAGPERYPLFSARSRCVVTPWDRVRLPPSPGMHWKGGEVPRPSSRAPSLSPATAPLTPSASLNGVCNRQ